MNFNYLSESEAQEVLDSVKDTIDFKPNYGSRVEIYNQLAQFLGDKLDALVLFEQSSEDSSKYIESVHIQKYDGSIWIFADELKINDLYMSDDKAGIKELVDELVDAFYNEMKRKRIIKESRLGEATKLTPHMKDIIKDRAMSDFEDGTPLTDDEALEWFSTDKDIPSELADEIHYKVTRIASVSKDGEHNDIDPKLLPKKYEQLFESTKLHESEDRLKFSKVKEDYEFYKKPNGKIGVDKVLQTTRRSGRIMHGDTSLDQARGFAKKRIPFDQMSTVDKQAARSAFDELKSNGTLDKVAKEFNTSPRADVVPKASGDVADVYYDDNKTGVPDERIDLAESALFERLLRKSN